MATVDIGQFIDDIEKRPIIWSRDVNVANKGYLEDTWHELAEIYNCSKKILKSKWKGLRDNFRIEWKKIPRDESDQLIIPADEFTGSKWQYYNKLVFLADHMRTRNQLALGSSENVKFEAVPEEEETPENQEDTEEEGEYYNADNLPPLIPISEWQPNPSSHRKMAKMREKYSPPGSTSQVPKNSKKPIKKRRFEEPNTSMENLDLSMDDDYSFLMSLYPYMQLTNAPSNLKLRIKIQRLLYKELFTDDCDDK